MKVAHWMMLVRRMGLSKIHMSTARIVWASQMCTHCKERLQSELLHIDAAFIIGC